MPNGRRMGETIFKRLVSEDNHLWKGFGNVFQTECKCPREYLFRSRLFMADRKNLIKRNSVSVVCCKLYLWCKSEHFWWLHLQGISGVEGDPAELSLKCVAMTLNFFGTVFHLKMGMIPPNHLTCSLWGSKEIQKVLWKLKAAVRFNVVYQDFVFPGKSSLPWVSSIYSANSGTAAGVLSQISWEAIS